MSAETDGKPRLSTRERYECAAERLRGLIARGDIITGPPVSDEAITAAEADLGYSLSPSLKWFLRDFGPAQFAALPATKQTTLGRPQILAPGAEKRADLLAATLSLRRGKNDLSPIPDHLYPFVVNSVATTIEGKRHKADVYYYLDAEDTDEDGEHRYCLCLSNRVAPRNTTTFLDWLEKCIAHDEEKVKAPPYENLAARLRSDDCADRYTFTPPASLEHISAVESALHVRLPADYKRFLAEFGPADLGHPLLDVSPEAGENVLSVCRKLRRGLRRMPAGYVPFALGSTWVAPFQWVPRYMCFDTRRTRDGEPLITEWSPRAKRSERREETDRAFSQWLEDRIRVAEENPEPPDHWRNNAGWERYWARIISDEKKLKSTLGWMAMSGSHSAALVHLDLLRRQGLRRILFAGNGISLEPYVFRHLGFEVVVLDVSPSANRFVQDFAIEERHLSAYLPEYVEKYDPDLKRTANTHDDERSLERVAREHRPGGSVSFATGDLFTWEPDRPFDAIYSNRSFQGFTFEDEGILARRFFDWLRPGGICLLETINLVWKDRADRKVEAAFTEAGFFVHGQETDAWYEGQTRPGLNFAARKREADAGIADRRATEEERERQRLASGEKMLIGWHGSG